MWLPSLGGHTGPPLRVAYLPRPLIGYFPCRALMAVSSCSRVTSHPSKTTVPSISMAGNLGSDIRCIRPKLVFFTISVSKGYVFFSSATAALMLFHRPPAGSLK